MDVQSRPVTPQLIHTIGMGYIGAHRLRRDLRYGNRTAATLTLPSLLGRARQGQSKGRRMSSPKREAKTRCAAARAGGEFECARICSPHDVARGCSSQNVLKDTGPQKSLATVSCIQRRNTWHRAQTDAS